MHFGEFLEELFTVNTQFQIQTHNTLGKIARKFWFIKEMVFAINSEI